MGCGPNLSEADLQINPQSQITAHLGDKSGADLETLVDDKTLTPTLAFMGDYAGPVEIRHFVQKLSDRLIATSPLPTTKVVTHVLDCSAFLDEAHAGGHMRLCLSTLASLNDESELSFLLSHEICHRLLRHAGEEEALRQKQRAKSDEIRKYVTAGLEFKRVNDRNEMGALRRRQEQEADLCAIDLMVKAGQNPSGALGFLDLMNRSIVHRTSSGETENAESRQLVANILTNDNPIFTGLGVAVLPFFINFELPGEIYKQLQTDDASHFGPQQRIDSARQYISTHFQDYTGREPHRLPWAAEAKGSTADARLFRYFTAFRHSNTASLKLLVLAKNRDNKAVVELEDMLSILVSSELSAHPRTYARLGFARVLLGHRPSAKTTFEKMSKLPGAGFSAAAQSALFSSFNGGGEGPKVILKDKWNKLEKQYEAIGDQKDAILEVAFIFEMVGDKQAATRLERQACPVVNNSCGVQDRLRQVAKGHFEQKKRNKIIFEYLVTKYSVPIVN